MRQARSGWMRIRQTVVLEGIREGGFEVSPFGDHAAFRYTYEPEFRLRQDRRE